MARTLLLSAVLLVVTLLGTACNVLPTATPTITPTATQTPEPTETPTATPVPTSTPRPTATRKPTNTPTPTPVPFSSTDPLVTELESQGYTRERLLEFEHAPASGATYFTNLGQFGELRTGGPDFDKENSAPDHLSVTFMGQTYNYAQYRVSHTGDVHLVFFVSTAEGDNRVIADFKVTELNDRIADGFGEDWSFCLPYKWGDINQNDRPDVAVTVLWANNYTGGEVQIFELTPADKVENITDGLPGAMSHWDFDPESPVQIVVDLVWAAHDCLYPEGPFSFWLYEWDSQEKAFVDVTATGKYELIGTDYMTFLESFLKTGEPFKSHIGTGALVTILLLYDKAGQRDEGWQKYLELADEKNWPGSTEEALEVLRSDVEHFRAEYEAGEPFTPNDAGDCKQ